VKKKQPKEPLKIESSAFRSAFLQEQTYDSCRDIEPFGAYTLGGPDGRVHVHRNAYRAFTECLNFDSIEEVDRAIGRMLITIAQHHHRFLLMSEKRVQSFIERSGFGEPIKVFCGSEMAAEGRTVVPSLPSSMLIMVEGDVEHVGAILSGWTVYPEKVAYTYGLIVWCPWRISAIQAAPGAFLPSDREVLSVKEGS